LRFGIGDFSVFSHRFGDEITLFRRFATVQKLREVMPRLVFVRGKTQIHNLANMRMQNPIRIQIQNGGGDQFVVRSNNFNR